MAHMKMMIKLDTYRVKKDCVDVTINDTKHINHAVMHMRRTRKI